MRGKELVAKILKGERDFSGVRFDLNLEIYEHLDEMRVYLEKQNLEKSPVNVSNSLFENLKAKGLYLPFLVAKNANFYRADLRNADLSSADFTYAYLRDARLRGANLSNSYLRDARLAGANFRDTNLGYADIRGADLENALNLGFAIFNSTRVTEKEEDIIMKALKSRKLFAVERPWPHQMRQLGTLL